MALGVGTGSLSILPSLHPPFTILFTPHPAQSNPAPSAPQSQGVPSPAPAPPPAPQGLPQSCFCFFLSKRGKEICIWCPSSPPPRSSLPFSKGRHSTPSSKHAPLGLRGSLLAKKKHLGAIQSCPHEGKASLQDAWLRWWWGCRPLGRYEGTQPVMERSLHQSWCSLPSWPHRCLGPPLPPCPAPRVSDPLWGTHWLHPPPKTGRILRMAPGACFECRGCNAQPPTAPSPPSLCCRISQRSSHGDPCRGEMSPKIQCGK